MACCAPNNPGPGLVAADSCKRVNYVLGMLLGVDDFVQESAYNGSRRRELARELLGYGTAHGLQVVVEPGGDNGARLRVAPGMAWLPSGTPVCVDSEQCASLNDWIAAHSIEVQAALADSASSPPRLTLYLVLSYVQCLTDNVPIPGDPCRSEEELMKPSRIADSFRLELRLVPPNQREEDALRDFVDWLVRLPLAPTSPPLDEAAFIEQVREAARDWLEPGSPPVSPPDYMTGAAPAGTNEALFRAGLRLWTTELRPLWMARADCGCSATPIAPADDAVLLAQLDIDVMPTLAGGSWVVSDQGSPVEIDESRRPVLLSLRMVQELILRQWGADPGDFVVPETAFGQLPASGTALEYARADHTHGTPELPELPALGGDLSGTIEDGRIESLQGVPLVLGSPMVDGQVLTFDSGQWTPRDVDTTLPDLGGDVGGAPAANEITRLQGHLLNARAPAANQMLRFVGNQWVPVDVPVAAPVPDLAGDVSGTMGTNRLDSLQGRTLNAPNPAADQVLGFVSGEWRAIDLPAPPPAPPTITGRFVGRGTAEAYEIVAAGEVHLALRNGQVATTMQPSPAGYGRLMARGTPVDQQEFLQEVIDFRATVQDARGLPNYIVKLTPIWTSGMTFGFRLFLLDELRIEGENLIDFRVLLLADQQILRGEFAFRFQVEVSRF
ncbi:hypothetical protein QTI24_24580 [Variovorax sp. J22P240]|uniref:hypothetical protein n=1 Tax=Variovorax sp. J22P240 TaxID=3053514 RepID=UPI0025768775|nr:hypothetical protein [Variovorax sp. J22P240]MDM0001807.1 hypothetical protein [Variovorax sp. J22P240]